MTHCASANGRKDDWDDHLPLTAYTITNAASTLGDLTLFKFFFNRGANSGSLCRHFATTSPPATRRRTARSGYGRLR